MLILPQFGKTKEIHFLVFYMPTPGKGFLERDSSEVRRPKERDGLLESLRSSGR